MEVVMSNDDLAIELCSYLFGKDLAVAKCISRRWHSVISSPEFRRALISRVKELSGFYFQYAGNMTYGLEKYLYFMDDQRKFGEFLSLDFLPERVVVMASSNGLMCCRSLVLGYDDVDMNTRPTGGYLLSRSKKRLRNGSHISSTLEPKLYVCNPFTKEWAMVNPPKYYDISIPLTMTVCVSSTSIHPIIKLVAVRCLRSKETIYTFMVYSSETHEWRMSKEICYCSSIMRRHRKYVVGSKCHWVMTGHRVMVFDVDREHSLVIDLPRPKVPDCDHCLGIAEGCLHYLSVDEGVLVVWMLKDYDKVEWVVKHRQCPFDQYYKHGLGCIASPLGIHGDEVFLYEKNNVYTYNLRTKIHKWWCDSCILGGYLRHSGSTFLPFTASLASVAVLKVWHT